LSRNDLTAHGYDVPGGETLGLVPPNKLGVPVGASRPLVAAAAGRQPRSLEVRQQRRQLQLVDGAEVVVPIGALILT
jgi:hypothetical protein